MISEGLIVAALVAGGLLIGFLLGLKFDDWTREAWRVEMSKRLEAQKAQIAQLSSMVITDIQKPKRDFGNVNVELPPRRFPDDWPDTIG